LCRLVGRISQGFLPEGDPGQVILSPEISHFLPGNTMREAIIKRGWVGGWGVDVVNRRAKPVLYTA
jgi:hypothetical protein